MEVYEKNIIPYIESIYHSFTPLEKNIADFFINNTELGDLSSKSVAGRLFVSEASLSRFAKKCGFRGYREFLFCYEQGYEQKVNSNYPVSNNQTKNVLNTYQELLNKSYSLVDEQQMTRIVDILSKSDKKRVYVYGMGSSGLVGMEMKIRFMRIGVNVEAITDSHIMKINSVLLDEDCVVIGISVSGHTEEVMKALSIAKKCGAVVILMTSRREQKFLEICDEVVLFAVKENLEKGKVISPQFPILVMVDILFAHILESDKFRREIIHEYTLDLLEDK